MDYPLKAKFSNLKPKPYHLDLFDCTVSVVIGDAWQEKAHPSIRHISGSMDYILPFLRIFDHNSWCRAGKKDIREETSELSKFPDPGSA